MKLTIIMADPAGNRTAIVRTPVPAEQRAQIASKILQIEGLRAEQAGFETSPAMGGAGRLQMMGGEFCGNAARSYGYLLWKERQKAMGAEEGAAGTIQIEISGSPHPLQVYCDPAQGSSYAQMPLPAAVEYSPEGFPLVISQGITHMILKDREPDQELISRMVSRYGDRWDAFGIMFLKGDRLIPVVYVSAAGSLVYESSCGSGSLAAAWFLEQKTAGEGLSSYTFEEPGGTIRVEILRRKDGSLSGRMGGALFLEKETEIEL
jgi:diaminopimelate epimerase